MMSASLVFAGIVGFVLGFAIMFGLSHLHFTMLQKIVAEVEAKYDMLAVAVRKLQSKV